MFFILSGTFYFWSVVEARPSKNVSFFLTDILLTCNLHIWCLPWFDRMIHSLLPRNAHNSRYITTDWTTLQLLTSNLSFVFWYYYKCKHIKFNFGGSWKKMKGFFGGNCSAFLWFFYRSCGLIYIRRDQSVGETKVKVKGCSPSNIFSLYSLIKESASSFSRKVTTTSIWMSVLGLMGVLSFFFSCVFTLRSFLSFARFYNFNITLHKYLR